MAAGYENVSQGERVATSERSPCHPRRLPETEVMEPAGVCCLCRGTNEVKIFAISDFILCLIIILVCAVDLAKLDGAIQLTTLTESKVGYREVNLTKNATHPVRFAYYNLTTQPYIMKPSDERSTLIACDVVRLIATFFRLAGSISLLLAIFSGRVRLTHLWFCTSFIYVVGEITLQIHVALKHNTDLNFWLNFSLGVAFLILYQLYGSLVVVHFLRSARVPRRHLRSSSTSFYLGLAHQYNVPLRFHIVRRSPLHVFKMPRRFRNQQSVSQRSGLQTLGLGHPGGSFTTCGKPVYEGIHIYLWISFLSAVVSLGFSAYLSFDFHKSRDATVYYEIFIATFLCNALAFTGACFLLAAAIIRENRVLCFIWIGVTSTQMTSWVAFLVYAYFEGKHSFAKIAIVVVVFTGMPGYGIWIVAHFAAYIRDKRLDEEEALAHEAYSYQTIVQSFVNTGARPSQAILPPKPRNSRLLKWDGQSPRSSQSSISSTRRKKSSSVNLTPSTQRQSRSK